MVIGHLHQGLKRPRIGVYLLPPTVSKVMHNHTHALYFQRHVTSDLCPSLFTFLKLYI